MCSLSSFAWRKQLESSIVMNGESLQGGYELLACNNSEESFGMLLSVLIMFPEHSVLTLYLGLNYRQLLYTPVTPP